MKISPKITAPKGTSTSPMKIFAGFQFNMINLKAPIEVRHYYYV